ncbi:acyltransferase [Modestobacter sp. VKM Ac-2977]|uniref:acyltransferase family protein n=1 Tax=Modestobacter sp. VKM Ac-2977 TaxID=3004131 RepID=UPI0022AA0AEA|nr:acyltransferase [Modestobacter sp. VKM Ac-2977]MCZ2822320.1 acyltransferase [Modestobacter sp. VKM Ac-2977]
MSGAGRLSALDGLRGIAALVVVVHHGLLTWQVLAMQYFVENRASGTWWLTFTPLHLVWAGTEAVMVFFVLSGLVLALPFLERPARRGRWRGYYGQRLVRLYVPAVASLVVAAAIVLAFPRQPGATTSWWFDAHAVEPDVPTLLRDALLLDGSSGVNSVLWSLHYEVLFSLLLPGYLLLVRRLGQRSGWLVPPLLLLVGCGVYLGSLMLSWLPVFGLGVVMAVLRQRLQRLGADISRGRHARARWLLLSAVTVVLLLAEWWTRSLLETAPAALALARTCGVAGAVLLCFTALACPSAGSFLTRRPVQWLGTVSFSLYLVHEPVLVSVSSLVGGSRTGVAVTLLVGMPLAFLLAVVFHRLVEAPSQRLARVVGVRLGAPAATAFVGRHRPAPAGDHPLPTQPFPVQRLDPRRGVLTDDVLVGVRGPRSSVGAG